MNYVNISEAEYCNLVLKRIKQFMDKNEVKQLDLSRESNINQSTLSKIMNGEAKLTLQHIFRICCGLKIEPEILLSFDEEISDDTLHPLDAGIINKRYLNDQILIRNTTHSAFKGYITDDPFFIYMYSTISSESMLLEGTIKFEDSEYHNFCRATMNLFTGKTNSDGTPIVKKYYGELIISLTMGTCYCILINPEIGEVCSLNFKHTFLFNQKLICRVGIIISTSSGTNKLPIMQRILITETPLNVNNSYDPDFEFVRGQLKLNDSEIIINNDTLNRMLSQSYSSDELKDFILKCIEEVGLSLDLLKNDTYSVFDENKIRSINALSDIKAQAISILRNNSVASKYNKISTKTDEFTFQYISSKKRL